jgi:hypothetical protein
MGNFMKIFIVEDEAPNIEVLVTLIRSKILDAEILISSNKADAQKSSTPTRGGGLINVNRQRRLVMLAA